MCAVGSQHPATPLWWGSRLSHPPPVQAEGSEVIQGHCQMDKDSSDAWRTTQGVHVVFFIFVWKYLSVLAVCILSLMHVLYTVYVHIHWTDSRKTTINSVQFKWEWTNVYAEICYANVTWGLLFFISVADIAGARSQEFHSPRHMCCDDVTIKLIWFDFQWAAWLWLFALFFTQLFNILYRFFILLFCWSAYFVHITIVSSSFCLNGLKSFSLFSFSCFWFALLFFPHFVKF